LVTGNIFNETYILLKDFINHKFNNKSEKIEYIKKVKQFEDECNKSRARFDEVVNKIKRQDVALIESARNSFRPSTTGDHKRQPSQQMNVVFMNGKDYLYSEVEDREKTVNLITKYN